MKLEVITQNDVGRIHEKTLEVLEKTGIHIHDCPEAAAVFRAGGCDVSNGTVRIPRTVVERCVASLPDRNALQMCVNVMGFGEPVGLQRGQTHFGLIGNAYYLYDYKTGRRGLVESDLHDKDLMLDHLGTIEFDCNTLLTESLRHCEPGYRYETLQDSLDFLKLSLRNRTGLKGKKMPLHLIINRFPEERPRVMGVDTLYPLERMEVLRHMIVNGPGATEELMAKDTPMIWCNPVSPMQLHPVQLQEIMGGIKKYGAKCFVMFSPEVMSGATGPVTLAGTLIQHNAEVLSGVVFTQLCRPGTAAIYGSVTGVMDMRIADISLGSFESQAISGALIQMADFYGLPNRVQLGNSSSNRVGTRSALEALMGIQIALSAGANLMTSGLLDSSLMMSYEHLVLMDELFNQCRSASNIDTTKLDLDAAVVLEQGHPSPDYLGCDHTLAFMKESIYTSEYTGRVPSSNEEWYDHAHTRVEAILRRDSAGAEHDRLVDQQAKAVEARLREDDRSWRNNGEGWWKPYIKDL